MTTIAATLRQMAADSQVVADHATFRSSKLLRTKRGIFGGAGSTDLISEVMAPWQLFVEDRPAVSDSEQVPWAA